MYLIRRKGEEEAEEGGEEVEVTVEEEDGATKKQGEVRSFDFGTCYCCTL